MMKRKTTMCNLLAGCALCCDSTQAAPWKLDSSYPASVNKTQVAVVVDQGGIPVPANLKMVYCEGGTFPYYVSDAYELTLGSFYIGRTEVTYAQWDAVRDWAEANGYTFANAGQNGGSRLSDDPEPGTSDPVTKVSFRDCLIWCNALSELCGLTPVYEYAGVKIVNATLPVKCNKAVINTSANGFRLPSEPEWECAAKWQGQYKGVYGKRCPTDTLPKEYWTPGDRLSGQADETESSVLANCYSARTEAVGGLIPNLLGCYDMTGNVAEWCFGTAADNSIIRNMRGGSWVLRDVEGENGLSRGYFPDSTGRSVGFRLALPGSSKGTDYVAYGGAPADSSYVAPANPDDNAKVTIRFSDESHLDEYLGDPSGYPILAKNLDGWDVGISLDTYYDDRDPALYADLMEKQQIVWNSFQAGIRNIGPKTPGNDNGFTVTTVDESFDALEALEADGYKSQMHWHFREDVKLDTLVDGNGNIDLDAYPEGHAPPYPTLDARILSQQDVDNIRSRIASSTLSNKQDYEVFLLTGRNTMLSMLDPDRMVEVGATEHPNWPWHEFPTPALSAEVLAYIKANFDGIGEEFHLQEELKTNAWDWVTVESIAASANWALNNGLKHLVFMGGTFNQFEEGIGPTRNTYETIFQEMEARDVDPSDSRITYILQGGRCDNQHVFTPENIDPEGGSMTVVSHLAWLATRIQQNVKFDLVNAAITNGKATITKDVIIQGNPCTITLTLSGYGTGIGVVPLLQGTSATAGGLTVGNNAIDIGEGINVDIVITDDGGVLTNVEYKVASFTLSGTDNSNRDYSLSSLKGTTVGARGTVYDTQTNVRSGSGIWVDADMARQALRANHDFAWNRIGTGGTICGLESVTLMFYTPAYDYP